MVMHIRTLKFTIEYDGTHFNGWQIQPAGRRTVQGVFEKALQSLFQKHIRVYGSGRTDSGVHALGQVAHASIATDMDAQSILRAVNAYLPEDAVVKNVEDVKKDFHAQFSAKKKRIVIRYGIDIIRYACNGNLEHIFFIHSINGRCERRQGFL